jgi:hypothetical protein
MAALPASYSIVVYEGDSTLLRFLWKDNDGNPISLVGASARLAAKRRITDPDSALVLYAPLQIYNDAKGKLALALVPSETKGLALGNLDTSYIYDLEIDRNNGFVQTIVRGTFTVVAEVE